MKYNISEIVKYYKDSDNTYIILATKEQPLNIEYLKSIKGIIKIDRLEEFAKANIKVSNGFDYIIMTLRSIKDGSAIIDTDSINVFENDIER